MYDQATPFFHAGEGDHPGRSLRPLLRYPPPPLHLRKPKRHPHTELTALQRTQSSFSTPTCACWTCRQTFRARVPHHQLKHEQNPLFSRYSVLSPYAVATPTALQLFTRRTSTRPPLLVPAGVVHARARKQSLRVPWNVPLLQSNTRSLGQEVSVHFQQDSVDSKPSSKKESPKWLDTCSAEERWTFWWLFGISGGIIALFGVMRFNVLAMFLAQSAGQDSFVPLSVGQLLSGFAFGAALMASVASCYIVMNELEDATGDWNFGRFFIFSWTGGPVGAFVAAPVFWLTVTLEGFIWFACMCLVETLIKVLLAHILPAVNGLFSRPVRNVSADSASQPATEARHELVNNLKPQRHGNAAAFVKQAQPEDKEVLSRTRESTLAACEELKQQVAGLEKLHTELVCQLASLPQQIAATTKAVKDNGIDGQ